MRLKWLAAGLFWTVLEVNNLCLSANAADPARAFPDSSPLGTRKVDNTPFTIQTPTAASGCSGIYTDDASAKTTWAAIAQNSLADNFVLLQLDLGTSQRVTAIKWISPTRQSAPANYAIKTSADGRNWTLAEAQFTDPNSDVALAQAHEITANARYVRIETSKVGNGAGGQPACIAELKLTTEPPANSNWVYACHKTLSPSTYVAALEAERGNADGTWKNICLQPGEYTRPVKMRALQKVRLLASSGTVKLSAELPNHDFSKVPGCDLPPGGYNTVLSLSSSQDVVVRGLVIENRFVGGDYRSIQYCGGGIAASRAVSVENSNNIRFEETNIVSWGKNALNLGSSSVTFIGGSVTGWYFLAGVVHSTAFFSTVRFVQNENAQIPSDYHAMFYTDMSDVVFDDGNFSAKSGKGFVAGSQVLSVTSVPTFSRKWVIGGNTSANVTGWLAPTPTSGGFKNNVQVFLTGNYPEIPPSVDTYELIAPGTGDRVCSFAATGALSGCVTPDLPSVGSAEPAAFGDNLFKGDHFEPYRGATLLFDAGESAVGARALKISGATGAGLSHTFPALRLGTSYVFSFWAKADTAFSKISWNVQSGRGDFNCLYGNQIRLAKVWQNYSKTCVLDSNKPQLYMYSSGGSKEATFWVRDIKLRLN